MSWLTREAPDAPTWVAALSLTFVICGLTSFMWAPRNVESAALLIVPGVVLGSWWVFTSGMRWAGRSARRLTDRFVPDRAVAATSEAISAGVGWIIGWTILATMYLIVAGSYLVALYALVKFVKWAWIH